LLQAHIDGDPEAFGRLFARHRDRLWAVAIRTLGDPEEAADALQDAMISAFRRAGSFRGDSAVTTWLHRIVVNAALVQLRSKKRRGEHPIETLLPRFDQDGEWIDDQVTWTNAAETVLESRDSREMVRRCIERLPEKYRSVLVLRDIEELDTEEAAQSLSLTANTVKVRLHRARQALKTLIERETVLRSHNSNHARSPV